MNNRTHHAAASERCEHREAVPKPLPPAALVEGAARIFRALSDPARLRTLALLQESELCVSELAAELDEEVTTVSHRLRLLRADGIVGRRREGRHMYYRLIDHHVKDLLLSAFEHASEPIPTPNRD